MRRSTSVPGPRRSRGRTRRAWAGARIVNFTPASASTSSVSSSTAVSGSHIPSGSRPNRRRKSSRPQRTWVTLSRPGGERHDLVVVDLGERVAVAAAGGHAGAVGLHDGPAHTAGRLPLQPREQRGPDVERDPLEVVDDVEDAVGVVDAAGGRVGRVALGGDALVPVVVGGGRVLHLDGLQPGVLARRLVEVAVDDDGARRRPRPAP